MKYSIEEIEAWSQEGSVTSATVVLELCAEIKRLRAQQEAQMEINKPVKE